MLQVVCHCYYRTAHVLTGVLRQLAAKAGGEASHLLFHLGVFVLAYAAEHSADFAKDSDKLVFLTVKAHLKKFKEGHSNFLGYKQEHSRLEEAILVTYISPKRAFYSSF